MSTLINRKAITVVWLLLVLGLFWAFGSPLTVATSFLLLFVAIAPQAILHVLWKEPPLTLAETMAEELRSVQGTRTGR